MLHYPKIPGSRHPKIPGSRHCPDGKCVAFEKHDGTNLHWDWHREFGWHSFGTRRDEFIFSGVGIEQFGNVHANLHESVEIFRACLAGAIEKVFHDNAAYRVFENLKVFTEFLGPNSFSGLHKSEDPKQVILFDVLAETYGFIGPEQFVRDFGHLAIPRLVYRGKLTGKFCDDVRQGKYAVNEGVVCKGGKGGADFWMAKIKTHAYMEKLKAAFAENWEDHWE